MSSLEATRSQATDSAADRNVLFLPQKQKLTTRSRFLPLLRLEDLTAMAKASVEGDAAGGSLAGGAAYVEAVQDLYMIILLQTL